MIIAFSGLLQKTTIN